MSKAEVILKYLHSLGAIMSVEADRLRIDAPTGVLTPEVKAALIENKSEIIGLLQVFTPPVIREPNGEDPLDYRFDLLTGEWRHEPDWCKNPVRPRAIYKDRAPCPRCGGTRFWVTVCHSEVCEKCHPPRPEDRVIGWITTRRCIAYEPAIS